MVKWYKFKDDIKLLHGYWVNEMNPKLPYLDPPYINPPVDLCAWGLGGKGGGFEPELEEAAISLGLQQLRRAFGFGPPAPIGSRDGESNEREADLAFIPTPSQGFGGADIT